jgi:acyl-[acyl-carrier-protein]-phospholipid O-acyltransferase / long-chain-fatty-acid--[acyl-carrier-protein] ligase
LQAVLTTLLLPFSISKFLNTRKTSISVDDTATVLFSSGSTGTPKGIVLSHRNLISNLISVSEVLDLQKDDIMLGSLPFFHSFGFIGNFLLPLYHGMTVIYHNNPMDAETIGELIREHQCTTLFATPTFLKAYTRKCSPEQMKSLKLVIAGAEKLTSNISNRFTGKFGITPIEGYGCTETSPVVSINVPAFGSEIGQKVGKSGSVGRPIPGVTAKIVDPDAREAFDTDQEGLLLVSGPNIMQGYLGEPERTREVLQDGWYNTGDMARIDADGYIFITGRYARFSKVAGEMVPHGGIEEEINNILGLTEPRVVVTGVADPVKGERLIVLHLSIDKTPDEIVEELRHRGLPNLWIPKSKHFYHVTEFPILGSGKIDLQALRDLADELTCQA